jgi:hypothetical protein
MQNPKRNQKHDSPRFATLARNFINALLESLPPWKITHLDFIMAAKGPRQPKRQQKSVMASKKRAKTQVSASNTAYLS